MEKQSNGNWKPLKRQRFIAGTSPARSAGCRQSRAARNRRRGQWRGQGNWRPRRQFPAPSCPSVGLPSTPVDSAKTRSPSTSVCEGEMARAIPSCAATAMRLSCALVIWASVATNGERGVAQRFETVALGRGAFGKRHRIGPRAEPAEFATDLERPPPRNAHCHPS